MNMVCRGWLVLVAMMWLAACRLGPRPSSSTGGDDRAGGVDPAPVLDQVRVLFEALASEDKHMLTAVSEQLREVSDHPEVFDHLLVDGRIMVPNMFEQMLAGSELESNASATAEGEERRIKVEPMMMLEIRDLGERVARRLTADYNPSAPRDATPSILLSGGASEIAVAWLLGHEACHHIKQHVGQRAPDLATAREQELEADTCAFELLHRAGYPLELLRYVLLDYAEYEDTRARYGLEHDEQLSSHPRFRTRLRGLEAVMAKPVISDSPWIFYAGFWPSIDGSLRYSIVGLSADQAGHFAVTLAFVDDQPTFGPAVAEYPQRGANVYRLPDRTQLYIDDTSAHRTQLFVAGDGPFPVFRVSFVLADRQASSAVSQALNVDALDIMIEVATQIAPDRREEINAVVRGAVRQREQLLLHYAKRQIEVDKFESLEQARSRRFELDLISLLGQDGYFDYQVRLAQALLNQLGLTSGKTSER